MPQKKLEPPDGGWGWMIVVAFSINYSMSIPMMQLFGLIFGPKLETLGLSATDISIIINTNQAFGMLMGLVNGVLLKKLGFRKVAFIGSCCVSTGIILSAFSRTFATFLFTYGIVYSLGSGMGTSAFSFALNTYFLKRRSKALGIALSISGLGPIFMPQLVTHLLNLYGDTGAVLILGAVASHVFIATALLQPVGYHMKTVEEVEDVQEISKSELEKPLRERRASHPGHRPPRKTSITKSSLSIDHDIDSSSIYGFDSQNLSRSRASLNFDTTADQKQSRYNSYSSLASVDEGTTDIDNLGNGKLEIVSEKVEVEDDNESGNEKKEKDDNALVLCLKYILDIFDLNLLTDPVYVNIMLGMSIAIFSEINFSMLTALILTEFGLSTDRAATFMSLLAIVDLIFRFLSPYIGDYLNKPPRIMYMISLVFLAATRFLFIIVRGYPLLLVSAVGLGVAKGLRTIYMNLVIPAYVPLERLPGASGIQMVTNGVFFILGGPFLGFIKDISGTYRKCVVLMNFLTLLTVVMWSLEIIIVKIRSKRSLDSNRIH
ncbi:monocarboxylate transporter 5-like isoform X2 [Agrilus planipennis]|uniref:Monocarboxylate transporter 5-like isoform X2 n=1 Tax=Agrilus planipennis TaxID=224129 RepID=A0A7F5R615_AGRPL|nr:monocarboxylate transporter 5-like isoform X2 [Agrilus planipennis]